MLVDASRCLTRHSRHPKSPSGASGTRRERKRKTPFRLLSEPMAAARRRFRRIKPSHCTGTTECTCTGRRCVLLSQHPAARRRTRIHVARQHSHLSETQSVLELLDLSVTAYKYHDTAAYPAYRFDGRMRFHVLCAVADAAEGSPAVCCRTMRARLTVASEWF